MKVNYRKIILSTSLITLACMVVLCAIISVFMVFVFPKNLADVFYSIGSNNIASSLYYRAYEKEDNIYLCYKALCLEINCGDNENTIKYFEEFKNNSDYENFMAELQKNNESVNVGILEKSALLNERNYLSNKYISALIKFDKDTEAFSYALDMFKNYNDITIKNQGVYALNNFIFEKDTKYSIFEENYAGFSGSLINCMQEYFDKCMSIFEENCESEDNLIKAYTIQLGNRLLLVGQNINTINAGLNINSTISTSNLEKMEQVNSTIKGLL